MSHEDIYEHPIEHHDPKEGFDPGEPEVGAIFMFTGGSVVLLILVIVAIAMWFNQDYQEAVYQKILAPPSGQLLDLRARDAWNMSHYMYGDLKKDSNRVRIPVDAAMDDFVKEAGAGKLFYPAKATAPKKDDYMVPQSPQAAMGITAPAAAGAAAPAAGAPAAETPAK